MIIQNLLVDQFLGMTVECLVPVSFSVVLKSSYLAVTLVPLMEILLMSFFDRYNIFYQFSVLYFWETLGCSTMFCSTIIWI